MNALHNPRLAATLPALGGAVYEACWLRRRGNQP